MWTRNLDAAMIILCSFIYYYSGHGVFATQDFCKGDFLLDYRGEIIRPEDGDMLPDQTYVYYFSINNNNYW